MGRLEFHSHASKNSAFGKILRHQKKRGAREKKNEAEAKLNGKAVPHDEPQVGQSEAEAYLGL